MPQSIFRAGIAKEFINTLFEVLSSGSHELLRDEIGLSIHAMASADFEVFFHQNLPSYLVTCQGIDDQQRMLLKNGFTNETVTEHDHHLLGECVNPPVYLSCRICHRLPGMSIV